MDFFSKVKATVLKKVPSPFQGGGNLYWCEVIAVLLWLSVRIFDIPEKIGIQNTGVSKSFVLFIAFLFALPAWDLWEKAFPPPEEDPTGDPELEAVRDHYRSQVYRRLLFVCAPVLVILIYAR